MSATDNTRPPLRIEAMERPSEVAARQAATAAAAAEADAKNNTAGQPRVLAPQQPVPTAVAPRAQTTAASNPPSATTQSATTGRPRRVGLRRQAAPIMDIDIDPSLVDDLQRMIAEFPDLKRIMAHDKNPTGVDGQYGPRTFLAIANIAEDAGISMGDVSKIKFFNEQDPLFARWKTALQNHHKPNETPQQVVQRVEQAQGPSAADLAAAAEAARLAAQAAEAAAAQAARDAANNRVPAAIRGTQYDPRYLATLSMPELINVAKDGLHGNGEIVGGIFGSYHRNGRLGPVTSAKLNKHARDANIIPRDHDRDVPLTRAELERTVAALGEAVARRTDLALPQLDADKNPMNPVNVPAPITAAPAQVAAVSTTTATTPAATSALASLSPAVQQQVASARSGLTGNGQDGQSLVVGGARSEGPEKAPVLNGPMSASVVRDRRSDLSVV